MATPSEDTSITPEPVIQFPEAISITSMNTIFATGKISTVNRLKTAADCQNDGKCLIVTPFREKFNQDHTLTITSCVLILLHMSVRQVYANLH